MEPGRAFGNALLLLVDGMLGGGFGVAHGSDTVTGVDVFVVALAAGIVAVALHVSCTGTTNVETMQNRFYFSANKVGWDATRYSLGGVK